VPGGSCLSGVAGQNGRPEPDRLIQRDVRQAGLNTSLVVREFHYKRSAGSLDSRRHHTRERQRLWRNRGERLGDPLPPLDPGDPYGIDHDTLSVFTESSLRSPPLR
jgi:hypothetical protein